MNEIRPIETIYNGYRFRSRLEARWAVFFDKAKIAYEYEPEGFKHEDGTKYLPDFYLPEYDWYVEVKAPRDGVAEELKKACKFVGNGIKVLILLGNLPKKEEIEAYHYRAAYYDEICKELIFRRVFFKPDWNGGIQITGYFFIDFASKAFESALKRGDLVAKRLLEPISDKELTEAYNEENSWPTWSEALDEKERKVLSDCYDAARQARFEHGENGGQQCT